MGREGGRGGEERVEVKESIVLGVFGTIPGETISQLLRSWWNERSGEGLEGS